MTDSERDRITRLEVRVERIHSDIHELKKDLKEATGEWRQLMVEFRVAITQQASNSVRIFDNMNGGWKVITILGALIIGVGTIATDIMAVTDHFSK